jgi:hypothetical protein
MKKLFEKPSFQYTFVLAIVAIVCGLAIGLVNYATEGRIAQNIIDNKLEAYSLVLPGFDKYDEVDVDGDPASVISKVIGKDVDGLIIGYIYEVYATNKFGYMRIVISVNNSGTILGAEFIEINQTLNVNGTKTNLSRYVGASIYDLEPNGDLISGATYSLTTVQVMLADVAVAHRNTVIEPELTYQDWFGMTISNYLNQTLSLSEVTIG